MTEKELTNIKMAYSLLITAYIRHSDKQILEAACIAAACQLKDIVGEEFQDIVLKNAVRRSMELDNLDV